MSKKSKSVSKPAKEFLPAINKGMDTLGNAYDSNAGKIQEGADMVSGLLPNFVDRFNEGDAGVNAARDYNVDVLSGNYLGSNPYTDEMIKLAMNEATNANQAALGLKGLTGGSDYANIISKANANAALGYRYNDYNAERNRMGQAASQAPSLAQADYLPVSGMLASLGASTAPLNAAQQYTSGIGGLIGGYGTQSQSPSPFSSLMGLAGLGLSGYGMGLFGGGK